MTINNATYTDAVHQNSTEFGIQVYPEPQLSSFTVSAGRGAKAVRKHGAAEAKHGRLIQA